MRKASHIRKKPVMVEISQNDLSNIFKSCWRLNFARFRRPKEPRLVEAFKKAKQDIIDEKGLDKKLKKFTSIGSRKPTKGTMIKKGAKFESSKRFFLDAIEYIPEAITAYDDLYNAYLVWSADLDPKKRITRKGLGKYLNHKKITIYEMQVSDRQNNRVFLKRLLYGIKLNKNFIGAIAATRAECA